MKEEYISIELLDTFTNLVCRKFSYLDRDCSGKSDLWSYPIKQCKRIEENPFSVNSVILETRKDFLTYFNSNYTKCHVLLTRIYILLYYKHGDDEVYQSIVFPSLIADMGYYRDNNLREINLKIDKIKEKENLVKGGKKASSNDECSNVQEAKRVLSPKEEKDLSEVQNLRKELEEERRKNSILEATVKELHIPIEDIVTRQKVILEFLKKIMMDNGCNWSDDYGKLKLVAKIAHWITTIPFKTCYSYFSNGELSKTYHQKKILMVNGLLERLNMRIRL